MPAKSKASKKKKSKLRVFKGSVCIIKDRCKGCGFCVECCPKQMLKISEEFNEKGYHYPVIIDEKACINCKICEDICPEFAIFSIGKEEKDRRPKTEDRRPKT
jgi:2-oxoglutarate ferredoxin oxidoreductase subunit delta